MMSSKYLILLVAGYFLISFKTFGNAADSVVQLNMNRPLYDVNEKFVSFAIKPQDLYRALDGDNRRLVTRMAAMMGESYIKFTNDYEFATDTGLKIGNPTKMIWKGFNRWARAVNWTMAIPVPYNPETWDPMETLRILNNSYMTGITECVWQLGTDFGASHAEDYVADLKTLNMMVESFKTYVDDWRIMGADISEGSSADETRRYIAMSKELNSAFGWTQSSQSTNELTALTHDNDPALRVLQREKVPIWLTLPQKPKVKSTQATDETTEGLNWAKTLGESASTGYDVIFKRVTTADLERPNFSYYITTLFKRVMGSRVFPARPLNMFLKTNKLYTHCANTASGGLAFMIVNMNEQPLQVQVASLVKLPSTELWQYTLTTKKSYTLLNNERLGFNTTLRPLKTNKQSNRSIQLRAPAKSVNFWVLPEANIDHCQYTEIFSDELMSSEESVEQKIDKRYSSSDILLRKLIKETSLANNPLVRAINRGRRFVSNGGRSKRFILKDKVSKRTPAWGGLFQPFADLKPKQPVEDDISKALNKREHVAKPEVPPNPFSWLTDLMQNTMTLDNPLLKRSPRSIDDGYIGSMFTTKNGRNSKALARKIADIRKAEKKPKKLTDEDEFDEEEFFKKLERYREQKKARIPENDVILKITTSPDGDEINDDNEDDRLKNLRQSDEQMPNEMNPFKIFPKELYESLPIKQSKTDTRSIPTSLGSTRNLFPESFLKNPSKTMNFLNIEKPNLSSQRSYTSSITQQMKDFIRRQKELSRTFDEDNMKSNESFNKKVEEDEIEKTTEKSKKETGKTHQPKSQKKELKKGTKSKIDYNLEELLSDNFQFFLNDNENDSFEEKVNQRKDIESFEKQKFDPLPWWDLDFLKQKRKRRALYYSLPEDDLHTNLISKDDEFIPLGAKAPVPQLAKSEYHVENTSEKSPEAEEEKKPAEHKIISTFKEKVSNLVDIVARQVSDWYETFTKHIDSNINSSKKADNSTKAENNNVK